MASHNRGVVASINSLKYTGFDMNTALLFYTNNLLPSPLLNETLSRMFNTALKHDCLQVSSSHFPITSSYTDVSDDPFIVPAQQGIFNFDPCIKEAYVKDCEVDMDMAFVTGRLGYSSETIARQIVHALRQIDCEKIILMEHDVLYPDDYVPKMSAALDNFDFAIYDSYLFMNENGFFRTKIDFHHLSRYAARRDALEEFFVRKIEKDRFAILEPVFEQHIQPEMPKDPDADLVSGIVVEGENPVLDVKHGANAAGQILVGEHGLMNDYWGFHPKYIPLFEDPAYKSFIKTDATLGYGLFREVM